MQKGEGFAFELDEKQAVPYCMAHNERQPGEAKVTA